MSSYARVPAISLVIALGGMASLFACATGDDSFNLASLSPVGTQSQGDDGGTPFDAGEDALNLPSPTMPSAPTDDSGSPATEDSAAPSQSEDSAAPPVVDSAAPPVVVDSSIPPVVDSGGSSPACAGYAPPTTTAGCDCDPTKHTCTANGCYNGYYCKLSTLACVTEPSGC